MLTLLNFGWLLKNLETIESIFGILRPVLGHFWQFSAVLLDSADPILHNFHKFYLSLEII